MNASAFILGLGVIAGLGIAVVTFVGITKRWGMLVPFIGMMLFGAMALPLFWNDRIKPTVWLPIQSKRSPLYLACGVLGCLIVMAQLQRLRGKSNSVSAILLLTAGLYAALLRFFHNDPRDGVDSIILSIATLVPMMCTASVLIDCFDDLRLLLRSIAILAFIWIGMVFVQIAINPSLVTMGNEFRFVGLFSNPQHSGVLLSFFCVALLWLVLNDARRYKLIYIGLLSVSTILLLWTGSRTGLGMLVIGITATLYSRVGRAILILPIVGIAVYIGLKLMVSVFGVTFGLERLVSTANTRDAAWWKLYSVAMENPIIGAGTAEAERSENSWLYGFASYGIGMLTILLALSVSGTVEIIRSFKARFHVEPQYRIYFDVLNGMMLMYFAGAMLEGYMISRVSSTLGFFMIASVANANLRRCAKYGLIHSDQTWYEDDCGSEWDHEYGDYGPDFAHESS